MSFGHVHATRNPVAVPNTRKLKKILLFEETPILLRITIRPKMAKTYIADRMKSGSMTL